MRGVVEQVNKERKLVAAKTDDGDYTIVELTGDDADVGDVLVGDLQREGRMPILNQTRRKTINVVIQNYYVQPSQVRQALHA